MLMPKGKLHLLHVFPIDFLLRGTHLLRVLSASQECRKLAKDDILTDWPS